MAKRPIAWHKKCLGNSYASLERKKEQLNRLVAEVERDTQRVTFYHVQIVEAEHQGKDGFDSELFLKKVRCYYIKE